VSNFEHAFLHLSFPTCEKRCATRRTLWLRVVLVKNDPVVGR
jgi:hypothetical protein